MRRASFSPRISLLILLLLGVTTGACKEEGGITVHKLDFKGVNAVDETRLKAALVTHESAKLPWGKKRFFDRSRFDGDLQRIRVFYADRGYPDARVASFDVNVNREQNAVDVVVTITEGEPVRVVALDFVGFDVIPARHLEKLRRDVPLTSGTPRDRQLVLATRDLAQNELRDHGYPYARVVEAETLDATGKQARLVFAAEPGILAHFGPVLVEKNKSVSANVIARELDYKPGDLYSRSAIQNAQRRLYGMALFQFVDIKPIDPDKQEAEVRTRVTVAEGKHQRVNLGAGYGSEEHGRIDAEYRHVNFFGAARSAGVHARWSSLDRGVRLDLNQPYFFDPHLSLGGEAQRWYTFTPAYESVVTGAKVTVLHRSGPQTSVSLSMTRERNTSAIADSALKDLQLRKDLIALGLDPITGKQEGTLSSFGVDLQHTTTDNLLNPRRGYQVAFHAEEAGVLLPGTFNYYAVSVDSRSYRSLGERLVMAGRLQLGDISAADGIAANVPFSRKYFLGGASALRGWGRYEVSPLSTPMGDAAAASGGGLPLGGNSLLAFTAEARATVRGSLGLVFFLDAGNVWADFSGMALNDLRYAIGPGVRYQTPVGPVRFDFGYQLNPIDGLVVGDKPQTHRWRLHFSIGEAF